MCAVIVEQLELDTGLRVQKEVSIPDRRLQKRSTAIRSFELYEHLGGEGRVNIVEGLELWSNVITPTEETHLIQLIEQWEAQVCHVTH